MSLTSSTNRRSRDAIKCKNQLRSHSVEKNVNKIDNESLKSIQNFQQEKNLLRTQQEQAQLQRAMYNARQTPLIPLITDIDFPCLFKPSEQQSDLLMNIVNLLDNINEQCSFF